MIILFAVGVLMVLCCPCVYLYRNMKHYQEEEQNDAVDDLRSCIYGNKCMKAIIVPLAVMFDLAFNYCIVGFMRVLFEVFACRYPDVSVAKSPLSWNLH